VTFGASNTQDGTPRSLPIHIPRCQKKWLLEEERKPKHERRPLPLQTNADVAIRSGGAQAAFDRFNSEYAFSRHLVLGVSPKLVIVSF